MTLKAGQKRATRGYLYDYYNYNEVATMLGYKPSYIKWLRYQAARVRGEGVALLGLQAPVSAHPLYRADAVVSGTVQVHAPAAVVITAR